MFGLLRKRRRNRIRNRPFPAEWRNILERSFPIYRRLNQQDRTELEGHILVFLAEKQFEGCGGQEITDEVRVLIAAQACLLLLHRQTDYYPQLKSVLVYPSTFIAKTHRREEWETTDRWARARLGESWQQGAVVLAWDAARKGAEEPSDGRNLVLHEFAHQLDQEDGLADGVPQLGGSGVAERRGRYTVWAKAFEREFRALNQVLEQNNDTLLDAYGATDYAEFFAVATECFFEKPHQLKKRHPQLYAQLQRFYQQDPTNFVPAHGGKVEPCP